MRNYDNLVEAFKDLKSKGYTYDFNLLDKSLNCEKLDQDFSPVDFNVEEVIHFEGDDSSAETRSILYVIQTRGGIKGTLLTTNSIYDNNLSKELIEKLR